MGFVAVPRACCMSLKFWSRSPSPFRESLVLMIHNWASSGRGIEWPIRCSWSLSLGAHFGISWATGWEGCSRERRSAFRSGRQSHSETLNFIVKKSRLKIQCAMNNERYACTEGLYGRPVLKACRERIAKTCTGLSMLRTMVSEVHRQV